jgi:predicted TIM-barrel enzyme
MLAARLCRVNRARRCHRFTRRAGGRRRDARSAGADEAHRPRHPGADALIVSGRMTGNAPDLDKVREAKRLAGDRPLLVGSGAAEENIAAFLGVADGVIVGSSLKEGGVFENPVDVERVRRFVAAARRLG